MSWQEPLMKALESEDPDAMKKALGDAPPFAVTMALNLVKEQGHAHFRNGNYEQALHFFGQALSLDQDDFYVLFNRGECLFKLERYDEAKETVQACIATREDYTDSYRMLADICLKQKDKGGALAALTKAVELKPENKNLKARHAKLEKEINETQEVLKRVFDPESAEAREPEPPPELAELGFDPVLLVSDSSESIEDDTMYRGLGVFLHNHADIAQPRELIRKLEDEAFLQKWLKSMAQSKGKRVLIWGSYGGTLANEARKQEAAAVITWEPFSWNRRLAEGIFQKNLAKEIHGRFGAEWGEMDDDTRRSHFEEITDPYTFLLAAPGEEPPKLPPAEDGKQPEEEPYEPPAPCDVLVYTDFDHGLVGNGAIAAIRKCREHLLTRDSVVLPACAKVFAVGIEWDYQREGIDLAAMDPYRWSPYPQAVDLADHGWRALTETAEVAVNLVDFKEETIDLNLKVAQSGNLHGILFWYELDMGNTTISTAPDTPGQGPGQAYQYVDAFALEAGQTLNCQLSIAEDRLFFQPEPPITRVRSALIPSWHADMTQQDLGYQLYAEAVSKTIAELKPERVLNIGAADGFLALTAAKAGATVYAVELSKDLSRILEASAKRNNVADLITVINEDPRKLELEEQIPEKVDLVIFDAFDCGLLGNGIIHYLEHVITELTHKHTVYLPKSAKLKAHLVEKRMDVAGGCDVGLLTPYLFTPEYTPINLNRTPNKVLSDAFDLYAYDFAKSEVTESEQELEVTITQAGICGAIVFYYELQLTDDISLSCAPDGNAHGRGQAIQFLAEVSVEQEQVIQLKMKNTSSNLQVAVKPDGIEKEQIITLPRFDQRWMSMSQNLMQQSGQLMQQLHANPKEHEKAGQLAARMAAHPLKHGLTPAMADSFFKTFMVG